MTTLIPTPLLDWLDLAGVAVFALTGALAAAREKQTFVTMAFFALLTGVGGGSVRDLLIGAPVFWVRDPWVAAACLAVAAAVWLTPIRWFQGRLIDYADGLGMTAYAVLSSAKALSYGVPPVPAFVMGVITGCVGGIIRDVIAGRPSILMRPELRHRRSAICGAVRGGRCAGPAARTHLDWRPAGGFHAARRGHPLASRVAGIRPGGWLSRHAHLLRDQPIVVAPDLIRGKAAFWRAEQKKSITPGSGPG